MSVVPFRVFTVLVMVAAAVGIAQPVAAAGPPVTSVWTENSSVNVFQDALPKPGAATGISLVMAKNEYEAAQVVIRKSQQFTIQNVTFTGGNIAAANLAYQFVEFEHLNHNTQFRDWPLDNPIRTPDGDFPDALSNNPSLPVPANTSQPIWIRAQAPANAGVYTGQVSIVTDAGTSVVPITVDVRNVSVPNAEQSSFTNAMWMRLLGPLDLGQTDIVQRTYGYQKYSADWWALMDKVAASMRAYRLNSLSLPLISLLLDDKRSYLDGSTYHFDWTHFDEVVDRFMNRNHAVNQLEGFGWFYGPNADDVMVTDIIGGTRANPVRTAVQSDSAEAKRWQTQFVTALRDHVRAKGWESRFWLHVSDEITTESKDRYRAACDTIHGIWPQVRIADANNVQESQELVADKEDFLIPSLIPANDNPGYYANIGKPFWLYTANIPTGSYLNRFIDQPVYAQREMMWYGYRLGATGYLHWAYDNWDYTMDEQDTKGDGWIVKPDKDNHTIKPTIRLESLRDGIEDWELLKIVGQTKPALAKAITEALVTNATNYSQDPGFITRMHNALVAAAAGGRVFDTTLTANAVASASSGTAPANAIDGDAASTWKSSGGSQWWQVDLTKHAQVDALRVSWATAPSSFQVQLSYNGSKWSTAATSSGAETFAGVNGKARYVRIAATCPAAGCALADVQIGGTALPRENLAGGKPYTAPATDPDYTDNGFSTDGVLAGSFPDRRSYGYHIGTSGTFTATVRIDLQATKSVGSVRVHRYEDYEQHYDPDGVVVATSTDDTNYTQKAVAGKTKDLWYDLTFPATQARYVKVTFTKNAGELRDYLFLDEIEAYAPPAGQEVNILQGLAYGKTEVPDDNYPDTNERESTDGVIAGGYGDGAGYGYVLEFTPMPLTIDLALPASKDVSLVRFATFDDGVHNYAPDRVDVYTSADGSSYQYRGSASWATGHWYEVAFAHTTASHIRLAVSKTGDAASYSDYLFVDEIAAYGG